MICIYVIVTSHKVASTNFRLKLTNIQCNDSFFASIIIHCQSTFVRNQLNRIICIWIFSLTNSLNRECIFKYIVSNTFNLWLHSRCKFYCCIFVNGRCLILFFYRKDTIVNLEDTLFGFYFLTIQHEFSIVWQQLKFLSILKTYFRQFRCTGYVRHISIYRVIQIIRFIISKWIFLGMHIISTR